ncbi:MAG: DUF4303 domain-containing protein [Gammaproteobacteria bacterium]
MNKIDWLGCPISKLEEIMQEPCANVDWKGLEEALLSAITSQVEVFAKNHPEETFYGFALDCNAYYADILFCLNTPESLEEAARKYADGGDEAAISHEKEELEWGLGDWKYQGFNLDTPIWETEVPMLDEFAELPSSQDTEKFLITCCRALMRAEKKGAFLVLRRTPDFKVACIDHDEDVEAGDSRLNRVRESS